MNEPNDLTHFSADGRARMVDVSEKADTRREAIASGAIRMRPEPGIWMVMTIICISG